MAPGNGANHKNSKSKKKSSAATSSQPPTPPAISEPLDSPSAPENTTCDPADPFGAAAEIYTASHNRAPTSHDRSLALRTLWNTALEIGRKMALEEIREDVLTEGIGIGKVLGRREERESCKGDIEKSYKRGYMVGQHSGRIEEREIWEKAGHSNIGVCSRAAPLTLTRDIATQTSPSSADKTFMCTVSTQTLPPPCTNETRIHTPQLVVTRSDRDTQEPQKLSWADDADAILPILTPRSPPPRDFSILSTGTTRPFGTLQRRISRSRSVFRNPRRNQQFIQPPPHYTQATLNNHWGPTVTHRHPNGIASGKPVVTISPTIPRRVPPSIPGLHLDWNQDPRLLDLSNALRSLGWVRPFG